MQQAKNEIRFKCILALLAMCSIYLILYGCCDIGYRKEEKTVERKAHTDLSIEMKNEQKGMEIPQKKWRELQPIDFAALKEKGYKILNENIAVNPKSIYEDSWLVEQLEFEIELDKSLQELYKDNEDFSYTPHVMEYFLFDLNGDGVDEYIIAYSGSDLGKYGSAVSILKKNEDGGSEKLCYIATEFVSGNKDYPLAILDERMDGYYSFVLPWTDVIWKYNRETGGYSGADKYRE